MSDIRSVLALCVGRHIEEALSRYTTAVRSTEFLILSDYVIGDAVKPNSVASFTIAPTCVVSDEFDILIREALPSDIKGARSVSDAGLELLIDTKFFHISFILQDLTAIGSVDSARLAVDQAVETTTHWLSNQPEGRAKFSELHQRFKKYRRELERRNPNLSLFSHVALVSNIAGYLAFLLSRVGNATKIAWVPDRDKITEAYDSIALDLFEINHFGLCDEAGIDGEKTQILVGIPDADSANQWFDRLIRIPDYLAGALSSFDLKGGHDISPKHGDVLANVVVNNPNCFVFQVTPEDEALVFRELTAARVNK